jgi:hypothetical protein
MISATKWFLSKYTGTQLIEEGIVRAIKSKYGFEEKRVAGCVVGPLRLLRWNTHNRRSERKMKKRHGENWREKYELERRNC